MLLQMMRVVFQQFQEVVLVPLTHHWDWRLLGETNSLSGQMKFGIQ